MTPEEIKSMIEAGIDGAQVAVDGDGSHFAARVVSDAFEGMPMVKQHQMVYATLGDSMAEAIHALSIQTYTQAQWEKASKLRVM
ncbi:MAG: BolA family protein [Gammaproteobacteria bacterium]